jgi:hypothetical protein
VRALAGGLVIEYGGKSARNMDGRLMLDVMTAAWPLWLRMLSAIGVGSEPRRKPAYQVSEANTGYVYEMLVRS